MIRPALYWYWYWLWLAACAAASSAAPALAQCNEVQLLGSGLAADHHFGAALALEADTLLASATGVGVAAPQGGAVYVFDGSGGTWNEVQKLEGSQPQDLDFFGQAVALSGDRAAVSAPHHAPEGGLVYVYERTAGTFVLQDLLFASDSGPGDLFGADLALSGDRLVVGQPNDDDAGRNAGAVYVFELVQGVWTESIKLTAVDGAADDRFGATVDIDGDTIAVGATGADSAGLDRVGAVYVFESVLGWVQTAKLVDDVPEPGEFFGSDLELVGDRLLVGEWGHDEAGNVAGALHLFERSGAAWSRLESFFSPEPGLSDFLGLSVAYDGVTAVGGAPHDRETGAKSGAVHVFQQVGNAWTQVAEVVPSDAQTGALYGTRVAISGGRLVVGKPFHDGAAVEMGAVYVYDFAPCPLGTSYCTPATPNSTGIPATISALGSWFASDNDFTVTAEGLPPAQFGYFITSIGQGTFMPPISQGTLCIGCGGVPGCEVGRYPNPGDVIQGPSGSLVIDLTAIPISPVESVLAGQVWNFQCWYRDGQQSNFTDAVSVEFR